jgi:hypothetical protein
MGGVWRGSGGYTHVSGREEKTKKSGSGKLCMEKSNVEGSKKGSLPAEVLLAMHH